jgi:hypothetical protein
LGCRTGCESYIGKWPANTNQNASEATILSFIGNRARADAGVRKQLPDQGMDLNTLIATSSADLFTIGQIIALPVHDRGPPMRSAATKKRLAPLGNV